MAYCLAKRRFSILYPRVLYYSSSSFKTEDLHKPFPKFLFAECGFTESEYKTREKRFRTLTNSKCIETFRKSVRFFRDFGFSEEQIKKIIINNPSVIAKNAEKTLSPKLECLKKLGFSQQKIGHMIYLNPRFLNCSLQDKMIPSIQLLEKVYNNNDDLCRALQVAPSILYKHSNVLQSLRLLKESGIEGNHLRILIKRRPVVLTLSPEILTEKMVFVKTLGISVPSKTFVRAVEVLSHCTMETVAAKIALLGSLGFQAEEIQRMLGRYPALLCVSPRKLKRSLGFLLQYVDYNAIVRFPQYFSYSLEKCLGPRQRVIDYLKEVEPRNTKASLISVVRFSRSSFLEKYVYPSAHCKILLEIYNGT